MIVQFFERRGIDYRWIVLALTFLTVFTVLGFRHAFGVMYVAILDDTGWLRAETAGIFSVAMVTYMLTAVASGALSMGGIVKQQDFMIPGQLLKTRHIKG